MIIQEYQLCPDPLMLEKKHPNSYSGAALQLVSLYEAIATGQRSPLEMLDTQMGTRK